MSIYYDQPYDHKFDTSSDVKIMFFDKTLYEGTIWTITPRDVHGKIIPMPPEKDCTEPGSKGAITKWNWLKKADVLELELHKTEEK